MIRTKATFEIPTDELTFASFRNDEAGLVTVKVFYMDYYDTGFSVRVTNEKLVASYVVTKLTKVVYQIGEAFDRKGMSIQTRYYDGTTSNLSASKVVIEGFNNKTPGTQLINVKYNGEVIKSFSIKVMA